MNSIPSIGLGTWKIRPEETRKTVEQAIRLGYRHIDCASTYNNEQAVGEAVSEMIAEGVIRREDIWISAKLPNTAHAKEDVLPVVQKSLSDLGLDYLDAYLMHWPVATRKGVWIPRKAEHLISLEILPIEATWEAMEMLVEEGYVRHIGVSNFSIRKLKLLLEFSLKGPEFNQVELHPYLQQTEMLAFCNDNDIQLIAYAPLGSGDRPKPLKSKEEPILLEDPVVNKIAIENNVSASHVLLAWAMQRGTAIIPKSVNPEHLKSNIDAGNLQLKSEEMDQINQLDRQYRYVDGSFWVLPNGPYSLSNLWDE